MIQMLYMLQVGMSEEGEEGGEVLSTITTHCLPKLVCQLYALTSRDHITQSEKNLINLIG